MGKQEKRVADEPNGKDRETWKKKWEKEIFTWNCTRCANRRSPLCELCTTIQSPDSLPGEPKYFIELEGAIPIERTSELNERGRACGEMIEKYLWAGSPVPIALVMEYNKHVDRCGKEKIWTRYRSK